MINVNEMTGKQLIKEIEDDIADRDKFNKHMLQAFDLIDTDGKEYKDFIDWCHQQLFPLRFIVNNESDRDDSPAIIELRKWVISLRNPEQAIKETRSKFDIIRDLL